MLRPGLAEPSEPVEAMPLLRKRRVLGIVIPVLNAPILAWNLYVFANALSTGTFTLNSFEALDVLIVIAAAVLVGILVPWWTPVYFSSYNLKEEGFAVQRFMRKDLLVPYKSLDRVELYVREPGEIAEEAKKYAKESSDNLRNAGMRFVDYTNSEANIVLLLTGRKVIMISPSKPKALLKSLKRRAPRLKAKIVELGPKGKTVQELE